MCKNFKCVPMLKCEARQLNTIKKNLDFGYYRLKHL